MVGGGRLFHPVADLSQKASSASDQEGLHFYVGSTSLLQKPMGVSGEGREGVKRT